MVKGTVGCHLITSLSETLGNFVGWVVGCRWEWEVNRRPIQNHVRDFIFLRDLIWRVILFQPCVFLFLLASDTMDFAFHYFLADARDNDELEVDDCWAAETDSDCVTASSTDGDSDELGTIADPVAEQLVERVPEPVAIPVPEQVAEAVAVQVPEEVPEPVVEPVPEQVPAPVVEPVPEQVAEVPEDAEEQGAECAKAKRFAEVRKKFNRGKGSRNCVGKETHFTVSLNLKRRAFQMMDDNISFPEIQRKMWDLTGEKFFLVNRRQLDNWKRATAKLDGLQPRGASRLSGAGRKTKLVGVDEALWKWFCERRAKNLAVTAKMLKTEADRVAHQGGYVVTQKWIRSFHQRHRITLRKSQRHTTLTDEERESRLNKFLTYVYMQPNTTKAWANFDEIPDSLAGLMSCGATLEHKGTENVVIQMDDKHFKRMATLIALPGVCKEGDNFVPFHLNPAIILKLHSPKVLSNPNNLLVTSNPTGVINSVYMRDAFIPYLVKQLQKLVDPTKVKLRIPFQFAPPAAPLPAPKPKPKAVPKPFPKQMSIASFFGRR